VDNLKVFRVHRVLRACLYEISRKIFLRFEGYPLSISWRHPGEFCGRSERL
jgi:hypothetical protein